jgi:TonB family protein
MKNARRNLVVWDTAFRALLVLVALGVCTAGLNCAAQTKPAAIAAPASEPLAAEDAGLLAAGNLVGRALILRRFYMANVLGYDAAGKVEGSPRTGDWTLAAMNVLKAQRLGSGAIELDGVRVAIRYNPDAHEFQRHPLNDEKMKLVVKEPEADPKATQLRAAFAAIFSVGIDPALQRSMPPFWQHYFDPNTPWPADALTGQTAYPMYGLADQPKDVTPPTLKHKVDAEVSEFAVRDKVKGTVQLRMVVDEEGIPRRIAVSRPLGYGMDERGAEAVAKWRFTPAMRAGKPVASAIVVNLDFQ